MATSQKALIDQLIKNNITLQQKTTELLNSMNNLSKEMKEMVTTFKRAAHYIEAGEIKEPLTLKLTELVEQNKIIANGLILLEKYVKERAAFTPPLRKGEL